MLSSRDVGNTSDIKLMTTPSCKYSYGKVKLTTQPLTSLCHCHSPSRTLDLLCKNTKASMVNTNEHQKQWWHKSNCHNIYQRMYNTDVPKSLKCCWLWFHCHVFFARNSFTVASAHNLKIQMYFFVEERRFEFAHIIFLCSFQNPYKI